MKRAFAIIISVVTVGLLLPISTSEACSRSQPFTLDELFNNADVIVRATALKYAEPTKDPRNMTTGEPDSTIQFRIEEKLRGKYLPDTIVLNGHLSDQDDFNDVPVPYMFVRPNGRGGGCFANTYKEGAQFLLFLGKTGDSYTASISALGPSNEQLQSDNDPWLFWVKDHLKSLSRKEIKAAQTTPSGLQWLALHPSFWVAGI